MAAGKISLQANDGKVAGIVFEDGASSNVTVTVPKEGGEFLTTEGNQTIAGVKTFSSSPIVPTPTTGTQAVNKDYVDSSISSTPTITGSATFNGTTQNINLTNIGNITLAIGDVIEVSGTTSNNKLFTVESIPNANQIIVNYEHRGTYTPAPKGRLINETASNCTIKLYNRAKNAPTGQGQYWCVPASGRTSGSSYTNTSPRSLQITFSSTSSTGEIQGYINGWMVAIGFDGSSSQNASIFMEVEPSSEYKIISPTTNDWRERR